MNWKQALAGILLLIFLMVGCSRRDTERTYVPPNLVIGGKPTPFPTPYRPKYEIEPR